MSPDRRAGFAPKPPGEPQDPLLERFDRSVPQITKRAVLLLDPTRDHRFLTSLGISGDISPMSESAPYLTAFQGQIDARTAYEREEVEPGSAEREALQLAETGIELYRPLIERYGVEAIETGNLFENITVKNSMHRWVKDPAINEPVAMLNYLLRHELFRQNEEGNVYTPDEQKALFATAVGFAQVKAVKELLETKLGKQLFEEDKVTTHEKRYIRDRVLGYAMNVLTAERHPELFQYLAAQKMYQLNRQKKD